MTEHRVVTPQPLPRFSEYFASHGKSFSDAAQAWAADRRILFPLRIEVTGGQAMDIQAFNTQVIQTVPDVVITFDDQILSPRFASFTLSFSQAASIICWTEGDQEIQKRKVSVVKARWKEDAGINPKTVLDLVGEAKLELISQTIMQAETIKEARFGKDAKSLPIVIIEDKITNMMKFMKEYIAISQLDEDVRIPVISEDELDKEAFEFYPFLTAWKQAIDRHANLFDRFRFVYVPPEKPEGEFEITNISTLRDQRIREWIKAGNEVIKEARARRSVIPTHLAGVLYKYTSDQFFHIEDTNTDLSKIITPRSIVVADVDGPLVSQQRVLARGEAALQSAYRRILDETYRKLFLVGFDEIAFYIINPTTKPAVVYREEGGNEYLLGIGTEFLKKENFALLLKNGSQDKVMLTIKRLEGDSSLEVDLALYKQALESIGYQFSGADMLQ